MVHRPPLHLRSGKPPRNNTEYPYAVVLPHTQNPVTSLAFPELSRIFALVWCPCALSHGIVTTRKSWGGLESVWLLSGTPAPGPAIA